MPLIIHIVIALLSIVTATATYVAPSTIKLQINNILIAATLVSGTYLVFSSHASLVASCASGLAYVTVVGFVSIFARQKLFQNQ